MGLQPKKYAGLYNGTARQGNPKELDKIIKFCHDENIRLVKVEKKENIFDILSDLSSDGIEIIFVIGGDGTIRNLIHGLTSSVEFNFKVVILGGGTMNAIAYKIGWSNSPYKNFITFLSKHDPFILGKTENMKKLKEFKFFPLKITEGETTHYGSYLFLGPLAKVIANIYDKNHSISRGILVVIISLFAALFGFPKKYRELYKEMPLNSIQVDGKKIIQNKISLFGVSSFKQLLCANLSGICIPLVVPFKGNEKANHFFLASYDLPFWKIPLLLFFIIPGIFPKKQTTSLLNQPVKDINLKLPNEEIGVIDGESRILKEEINISLLEDPIIFLCP